MSVKTEPDLETDVLDDCVVPNICDPKHSSELVGKFSYFQQQKDFTDLYFICKDNVYFQAHKVLLASVSDFLSNILSSTPNVHDIHYISLPDIDIDTLQLLVKFLYVGELKVDVEQLARLREVICLLNISLCNVDVQSLKPDTNFSPASARTTVVKTSVAANASDGVVNSQIVVKTSVTTNACNGIVNSETNNTLSSNVIGVQPSILSQNSFSGVPQLFVPTLVTTMGTAIQPTQPVTESPLEVYGQIGMQSTVALCQEPPPPMLSGSLYVDPNSYLVISTPSNEAAQNQDTSLQILPKYTPALSMVNTPSNVVTQNQDTSVQILPKYTPALSMVNTQSNVAIQNQDSSVPILSNYTPGLSVFQQQVENTPRLNVVNSSSSKASQRQDKNIPILPKCTPGPNIHEQIISTPALSILHQEGQNIILNNASTTGELQNYINTLEEINTNPILSQERARHLEMEIGIPAKRIRR